MPSNIQTPPSSIRFVHNKARGGIYTQEELTTIVSDIAAQKYTRGQIAAFLESGIAHPLSFLETIALTKAMTNAGETLKWDHRPILDKHCIGGLPGNRTTPIIVAILMAKGLSVPKTSSRAVTSAAGTADVMEIFTNVDMMVDEMRSVVTKTNGCIVCGGAVGLSPVDDELVSVSREIGLDSEGQMIASIMSKKLAAGATHLVIDIPFGKTAKLKSRSQAEKLARTFKDMCAYFNIELAVVLSDGSQPVGFGIGPALEARDVLAVLKNQDTAPVALRDKACHLAGLALELSGCVPQGQGERHAYTCLVDGQAYYAFVKMCKAQGGFNDIPTAEFVTPIKTERSGIVASINNHTLSRIARILGAPEDKCAGIDLFVSAQTYLEMGQYIFTLHSSSKTKMAKAMHFLSQVDPIQYSNQKSERIAS